MGAPQDDKSPGSRYASGAMAALTALTTIQANAHVTLHYTLKTLEGEVLDASRGEGGEPIRYVHGYGMIVPGLEAALAGLQAGEKKDVVVSAEEAFGDHDEELVLEVDRSEFPDPAKVNVGDEFIAESPDGGEVVMRVVDVREASVMVDANHPLAGLTLHYSVEVENVRPATTVEIENAAEDLDAAHEHVHGPDCDHEHGAHDLVGLGISPKKGRGLVN